MWRWTKRASRALSLPNEARLERLSASLQGPMTARQPLLFPGANRHTRP